VRAWPRHTRTGASSVWFVRQLQGVRSHGPLKNVAGTGPADPPPGAPPGGQHTERHAHDRLPEVEDLPRLPSRIVHLHPRLISEQRRRGQPFRARADGAREQHAAGAAGGGELCTIGGPREAQQRADVGTDLAHGMSGCSQEVRCKATAVREALG
jgi:hypothetical protein